MFEGCFYKANSDSTELHFVNLRLNEAEIKGDIIVHMIHVTGTRMKELRIDDFSRGEFLEGVMAGKDHLEMLTLDVEALNRAGGLKQLIRNWQGCQPLIKLDHLG